MQKKAQEQAQAAIEKMYAEVQKLNAEIIAIEKELEFLYKKKPNGQTNREIQFKEQMLKSKNERRNNTWRSINGTISSIGVFGMGLGSFMNSMPNQAIPLNFGGQVPGR
jgi:hypothetical protein